MADALKSFFSPALVARLAADLARASPGFRRRSFIRAATTGLDRLELLDRARHIARALATHLPPSYPDAVAVILRSLGPEHPGEELLGAGMTPFYYLPHLEFIAARGLDHFERSMAAQRELTKRMSAEFSIRAFLHREPERTMAVLARWASDDHAHVRRLVSEGTRLRLPWGVRVPWLDRHPARVLALLELLKDDPASMVRRSVANNLNDLGKVHPRLLIDTCAAWLVGATPERRALVEHALRSAVKRGDADALRLLGYGDRAAVELVDVTIGPRRVEIGGKVAVDFAVRSRGRRPQALLIDLAVHFVKASGATSRKVFKLGRVSLAPGDRARLRASVSLAVHTTRKPYPGRHRIEALVNGEAHPLGAFTVAAPARPRRAPGQRRPPVSRRAPSAA